MAIQERVGTKRIVVGAHYGTFDFIVQRCTAVIMAIYTLVLFFGVLFTSGMSFEGWQNLFTFRIGVVPVGQLLATLAFFSLAWHAWIGVRDIWMDYVKSVALRLSLQVVTIVWLVGCIGWGIQVLWRL